MVSTPNLSSILALLGSIFGGLLLLTLWIWRHTTTLSGEDEDRVVELTNDQRSSFSAELANLHSTIEDCIEEREPMPDGMDKDEFVVNAIERDVDEEDLETVVEELEDIDTPGDLYDSHREAYNVAIGKFARSTFMVFVLAVAVFAVSVYDNSPFDTSWVLIYGLIGFAGANYAWDGIAAFNRARRRKREFEERWRRYKRPD